MVIDIIRQAFLCLFIKLLCIENFDFVEHTWVFCRAELIPIHFLDELGCLFSILAFVNVSLDRFEDCGRPIHLQLQLLVNISFHLHHKYREHIHKRYYYLITYSHWL